MAEETQYTANTGMATLTTAATSMIGTGSTAILTATSGAKGTLLKSVTIKGTASNTSHNMIRLFIDNANGTVNIIKEIAIPPITQAAINPTFEKKIILNTVLKRTFKLRASTVLNDTGINIIAEGLDWNYYSNAVREDTTQYTANNGTTTLQIATANSNLNGMGSVITVYTAGSSSTYNGSSIETITIKATVTNTPGMVRLYVNNTTTSFLFAEVPIPSVTPDGTDQAFEHTITFDDNFDIQAGYSITASTQNGEKFTVLVEGKDWSYPS